MDNRSAIMRLLADGGFHSGEVIAKQLSISRAAVWKHLKSLQEDYHLELHSVRGKGYRLAHPLSLLDGEEIDQALDPEVRTGISRLEIFEKIDSTNSYVMGLALEGTASGSVCIAEQQTAGRGRRGRTWVSPYGSNIYLSVLWNYGVGIAELTGLSIAVGVAIARALERFGVPGVGLKWPNDVLIHEKKLAGILIEVNGEPSGPSRVIIGLGLNTWLSRKESEAIEQPWIDLSRVVGKNISRNQLCAMLLNHLIPVLAAFETTRLQPFMDDWQKLDLFFNQPITIKLASNRFADGVHRGITAEGALLVEQEGEIRQYHGGEVSLRKR